MQGYSIGIQPKRSERMEGSVGSPLFEKRHEISYLYRCFAVLHVSLFLCFLIYRLLNPIRDSLGIWAVALLCEAYFAFKCIIEYHLKWFPVTYHTFMDRFACRYGGENGSKLPFIDIIITSADIKKEPPIVTMNTVLSVLALDYPTEKFACYVSDDAASPILYYSLIETLHFSKKWIPFCRKHKIEARVPFLYFDGQSSLHFENPQLLQESECLKEEYESLKEKIEKAVLTREIPSSLSVSNDGFAFKDPEIGNHASVVKVIHEHSGERGDVPHIIYVAREKRPKTKHHYKAGAMNAMMRVSGLMTNAPYILNLDCDMFINNPRVAWEAMCVFLQCKSETECGFIQFPQLYYPLDNNSPLANQVKGFHILAKGSNGLQTAIYCGTGCFHRRKAIYGNPPEHKKFTSSWSDDHFIAKFGHSYSLIESAKDILREGKTGFSYSLISRLDEALQVSSCSFELNTSWGKQVCFLANENTAYLSFRRCQKFYFQNEFQPIFPVRTQIGWAYGSLVEDALTSMRIHSLGWHSLFCLPEIPGFLGCPPSNAWDSFVQQRRWVSGMMQNLFLGWRRGLTMQKRLLYAYFFNEWVVIVPITLCYTLLPIHSLLSGAPSLPQIAKPDFIMGMCLFLLCYGSEIFERMGYGISFKDCWEMRRNQMANYCTASLLGIIDVVLEKLGFTDVVFEVTPKTFGDEGNKHPQKAIPSPISTVPTTISLVSVMAILYKLYDVIFGGGEQTLSMMTEVFCCLWTILLLWPFLKGFVGRGSHGLTWSPKINSILLTLVFTLSVRFRQSTLG